MAGLGVTPARPRVAILGGACAHVVAPTAGGVQVRSRHAYGRLLEQLLAVEVVNASRPDGDATTARELFERTIRPRSPAVVVVHLDRPERTSSQLVGDETARIARLARYDQVLVLLLEIADAPEANQRLAHVAAAGDPDVRYVDLGSPAVPLSVDGHAAVADVLAAEIGPWLEHSGAMEVPA